MTTPTPHQSIFTGRMLLLMPNQQCRSTEGIEMTQNQQKKGTARVCHKLATVEQS